jgi:hypothetical protein
VGAGVTVSVSVSSVWCSLKCLKKYDFLMNFTLHVS